MRTAAGLERAGDALDELAALLDRTGLHDHDTAFNLTWHDWLNLDSLILVSRAITQAALARENSRGAHFREDFPDAGALETSRRTEVRWAGGRMAVADSPVAFTRVSPGESLVTEGRDATAGPMDSTGRHP
jgi:fumarate reductase flavoprotein subunit